MNPLLEAITALCNMQRDKHMRQEGITKPKKKKETGFGKVLEQEQKKQNGGKEDVISEGSKGGI